MSSSLKVAPNIRLLITAVENGNVNKVLNSLEQNVSVDTTDDNGNSLLHIAAANGHEEVVTLLCMKGASLDRTNLYGWTPLMQAARYGHENVALQLLHNKAKINATTTLGVTALTLAIFGGHTKMIELLLNKSELVLDDAENLSYFISPLFVATMYGRDDALRLLLRKGLPPNQNFKSTEWTSLMISALTGQLPMARLLVNKGANPNLKNKLGKTALEIATDCEKREVRGYLDRKTSVKPERVADKADSIITAVKEGDYYKVTSILEKDKQEANKSSSDGATPLMYASITGQIPMIDLLIKNGADIDARDYENGWTALMQATYYGKTQAAMRLIGYGANVHIRACNGVTAFDMAMLINLNDTNLFRMLAERMMTKENSSGDPNSPTKAWIDTTASSNSLMVDTGRSQTSLSTNPGTNNKKSLWSKMTRTMKSIRLTRTFKNSILPNKMSSTSFEETFVAPEENTANDPSKQYDATGGNVSISNPYAMTNHSGPNTHFPTDKLSPVVPPFQTSTGVDKQSISTQKKLSNSKTSMTNSLNSSGESVVSRSVVRPFKFLHSPNSSGRYPTSAANSHSPHSSGGATSVSTNHRRAASGSVLEPHNRSGDRNSDSVLMTVAKRKQRKVSTSPASVDGSMHRTGGISMEQVSKLRDSPSSRSQPESIASSGNTSSTITPPRSHHSHKMTQSISSRSSRSIKSGSELFRKPPSLTEEDELSLILRKLSLEKYHPIFEKQEIDMDAFLTLTQGDLSELGITQELPRQQILQAISQINFGKENQAVATNGGRDNSSINSSTRTSNNQQRPSWNYNH